MTKSASRTPVSSTPECFCTVSVISILISFLSTVCWDRREATSPTPLWPPTCSYHSMWATPQSLFKFWCIQPRWPLFSRIWIGLSKFLIQHTTHFNLPYILLSECASQFGSQWTKGKQISCVFSQKMSPRSLKVVETTISTWWEV